MARTPIHHLGGGEGGETLRKGGMARAAADDSGEGVGTVQCWSLPHKASMMTTHNHDFLSFLLPGKAMMQPRSAAPTEDNSFSSISSHAQPHKRNSRKSVGGSALRVLSARNQEVRAHPSILPSIHAFQSSKSCLKLMRSHAIPCCAVLCHAMPCHAIQSHHTTPHPCIMLFTHLHVCQQRSGLS